MNENELSFTVDLSKFHEVMGDTHAARVRWLSFHADISPPTARAWLLGEPVRAKFSVLRKVTEALKCIVDDVLSKTGEVAA